MPQRLTGLRLVYSVAAGMADELHVIARRRALTPGEARQVDAVVALADALDIASREENHPEFGEAFAPMLGLFAAADIATREGGLAVPRHVKRHPWPVTPAHLAWHGVSAITSCLSLIVTTPAAGRSRRRLAQLENLNELQRALKRLAEVGPGGGATARVQDAFVAAGEIIGDETRAIVVEAATIATGAAAGARN
jgi:hypothetical protein